MSRPVILSRLAIIILLGFAVGLRFMGLNWDADQHLHPDERFLTLVTLDINFPESWPDFFNTAISSANPHNVGHEFFVYGTLPVFLVRILAPLVHMFNYPGVTQLGRILSALFDSASVCLLYLYASRFSGRRVAGFLAAAFYALSPLAIQLAHYYATDSFLVFFLLLTAVIITPSPKSFSVSALRLLLSGLIFGLAAASKITALLYLPFLILPLLVNHLVPPRRLLYLLLFGLFLLGFFISFRITQPYFFADSAFFSFLPNPRVLENWHQLQILSTPHAWFPPGVQWLHTPRWFAAINLILWGWGIPVSTLLLLGLIRSLFIRRWAVYLFWLVALSLFIYLSLQFAMPMRYFLPITPFIFLLSASGLSLESSTPSGRFIGVSLLLFAVIFAWAFTSIYRHPHTRVAASDWIYQHLPLGSKLTCEYWDDCLPLSRPGRLASSYSPVSLHLYDPDTPDKWHQLQTQLLDSPYLILSSNRLYASIASAPDRYPIASRFYQDLFNGRLGYTMIAEFVSRPQLKLPFFHICLTPPATLNNYGRLAPSTPCSPGQISFVDDYADESFTVYDHPKVTIFQLTNPSLLNQFFARQY